MRTFEDWLDYVDVEISKIGNLNLLYPELQALKTNRTLTHLYTFLRKLHLHKLQHLCPTPEEIDNWIQQGAIRTI